MHIKISGGKIKEPEAPMYNAKVYRTGNTLNKKT
jgi:hypothetical protein